MVRTFFLSAILFWGLIANGQAPSFFVQTYQELRLPKLLERSWDSNSQKILASGFVAQGLAQTQDSNMRAQWVDHQRMNEDTAKVGDLVGMGALSVPILFSQWFLDHEAALAHARGFIAVGAATMSLKYAVGRRRPGTSQSLQSFPSGHTSTAFMSATVLSYSYGWKAAAVAYPLATMVGLSRLADDAHWFSDVVAGAFLGIWAGRAGSFEAEKSSYAVFPYWQSADQGLIFVSQF